MKTYFLQKKILKLAFSFFLVWALFSIAFAMKSNHGLDGFVENRIDATRNARVHSNMGNIYFDEDMRWVAFSQLFNTIFAQ